MLNLLSTPSTRRCDGSTRRDFLKIGSLGLGGLTLAQLLRARAEAGAAGKPKKNTSVVFLFLDGGASHLETFDPKPDAPKEYRCIFDTVPTTHPGVRFCGLLSKMARLTDKLAIVHSFTHTDSAHEGAQHWIKTGHPYPPEFFGKAMRAPDQSPAYGSIVARQRGPVNADSGIPNYVRIYNYFMSYHDGPAWLGKSYAPFAIGEGVNHMLNDMSLKIAPERLADRRELLRAFDRVDRALDKSGVMDGIDAFQKQAAAVVVGKAREAFDLSKEDIKTREKYRTIEKHGLGIGLNLLLARRLCEAGCGFVSLNHSNWDHHGGIVPGCKELCPPLDHAVATFIEDVHARGLEKDILLVITGEFGRTPRIDDVRYKEPGRDHWPGLNTLVLMGGGLKMGQVIGTSDGKAAYPASRPISPQDLMATMFHVLGIDPGIQYVNPSGRPVSMIDDGKAIDELL
jgi:uncharacterized protein (DUF1501 family)